MTASVAFHVIMPSRKPLYINSHSMEMNLLESNLIINIVKLYLASWDWKNINVKKIRLNEKYASVVH